MDLLPFLMNYCTATSRLIVCTALTSTVEPGHNTREEHVHSVRAWACSSIWLKCISSRIKASASTRACQGFMYILLTLWIVWDAFFVCFFLGCFFKLSDTIRCLDYYYYYYYYCYCLSVWLVGCLEAWTEHWLTLLVKLGFSMAFFSLVGSGGQSSRLAGRCKGKKRVVGRGFPACPAHILLIKIEKD